LVDFRRRFSISSNAAVAASADAPNPFKVGLYLLFFSDTRHRRFARAPRANQQRNHYSFFMQGAVLVVQP